MLRTVREIHPLWVVGENVRGLTNWNGGVVFDEVQADLEVEGYEVLPFLLPAAGVGAPHRRDRIWFIAHADKNGYGHDNRNIKNRRPEEKNEGKAQREERNEAIGERIRNFTGGIITKAPLAHPLQFNGEKIQTKNGNAILGQEHFSISSPGRDRGWDEWPIEHPVSRGDDGISAELVGLSTSEYRRSAIGSLGNSIVPQVVLQIFKAIEAYENL